MASLPEIGKDPFYLFLFSIRSLKWKTSLSMKDSILHSKRPEVSAGNFLTSTLMDEFLINLSLLIKQSVVNGICCD